jgi:hypothetical protein
MTEAVLAVLATCELHRYHSPLPVLLVKHHVRPVSWGGIAGTNTRLAVVCPTGHWDVHSALDAMFHAGSFEAVDHRHYGPSTWELAIEGWNSTPPEERDNQTL